MTGVAPLVKIQQYDKTKSDNFTLHGNKDSSD